ncbi:MAG: glycosyltransferase family 39 protein [Candidatus Diapherotrites archaeon]|nr:glycosyltransferase family 39 protein [Candidatus Diapherotrites archaeon]
MRVFFLRINKILLLLVLAIILVRIFTAAMLPDAAYTDSLYHLTISKEITSTGVLPFNSNAAELKLMHIDGDLPPPFFHVVLANFFVLSNNPLDFALASFFPVLITLLSLAFICLISREIFTDKKSVLLSFAFASALPMLTVYTSVNYPEALATLLVLFAFYLLIKFEKTKDPGFIFILPFVIAGFSLSKLTALVLLPVFVIAIAFFVLRSRINHSKRIAAVAIIFTLLFSGAWFVSEFQRSTIEHPELGFWEKFFPSNAQDVEKLLDFSDDDFSAPSWANPVMFFHDFNESFWFFLPFTLQEILPFTQALPLETIRFAFFALTFPLICLCLYGLFSSLRKRKSIAFLILLILIFGSIPFFARLQKRIYLRLLLVVLPFFGILFAVGFANLKKRLLRRIFYALFFLVVAYSLVFLALTAVHYSSNFNEEKPALEFIKGLPPDAKIAAQRHVVRHIIFFTGHDAEREWFSDYQDPEVTPLNWGYSWEMTKEQLESILSGLKQDSKTDYVLSTCSKSPWRWDLLQELEAEGKVELVFESECSKVHRII